ncbi:hypothetical protein MNBD_GAMMA20-1628 [hydrothermal vent metagenome]|uniref:Uncharacterized protein n=1 Tax=hydrothermal vent metagenome TaxID=652676 RepID=A0A3B1AA10_9ZZZZ
MPIFRFLIIGLAVWLAIALIRRLYLKPRTGAPRPLEHYVETVACRHCRVHVPREQALVQGKHFYCCPQHRDAEHD